MKDIRRINLFGAANAGKSANAGFIYSALKAKHYNIELVREVIKKVIYRKSMITPWDQISFFGRQFEEEMDCLEKGGVQYIVTDGPLLLISIYAKINKMPGWKHLFELEKQYEKEFPSINIFMNRKGIKYSKIGRIHSETEVEEIDDIIKQHLTKRNLVEFHFKDRIGIIKFLKKTL